MSKWNTPDWMVQYVEDLRDLSMPQDLGTVMESECAKVAFLIQTPEGRALSVNAQIGLLVSLHAQGLLKDKTSCSLLKEGETCQSAAAEKVESPDSSTATPGSATPTPQGASPAAYVP